MERLFHLRERGTDPRTEMLAGLSTFLTMAYPASPLTVLGGHHSGGPAAGERMPPRANEPPIGAGPTPRFAIFAEDTPDTAALFGLHAALLESAPRAPLTRRAPRPPRSPRCPG